MKLQFKITHTRARDTVSLRISVDSWQTYSFLFGDSIRSIFHYPIISLLETPHVTFTMGHYRPLFVILLASYVILAQR